MTLESYLETLFADGGRTLAASLGGWRQGIDYEVNFWTRWFQTRGLEWPGDYASRIVPQQMPTWLTALLPADPTLPAHVLDVGAGPIIANGHLVDGREIAFTAVDPLAHHYTRIIDQTGIEPPIRTKFAFAEDLSARFAPGAFQLVTCRNALDHAIEPAWGILEMLIVASVSGRIFLAHRRNEAEFENYSGFHQWNFDLREDGRFVIWNNAREIDVSTLVAPAARVECNLQNDFLTVVMTKLAELPIDPLDYQRKMRAGLLEALLAA